MCTRACVCACARARTCVCVCACVYVRVHLLYVSGPTFEKSGSSRKNDVRVECLPQIHVALLHRVGQNLLDPFTLLPNEVRLEQQLRSTEPCPANLYTHKTHSNCFKTPVHYTHPSYRAGCLAATGKSWWCAARTPTAPHSSRLTSQAINDATNTQSHSAHPSTTGVCVYCHR